MTFAEKIFIDVNGLLSLQRYEQFKPQAQVCPFRPGHHYCGEWCPHFGTPQKTYYRRNDGKNIECTVIELSCGHSSAILAPVFVHEAAPTGVDMKLPNMGEKP